MESANALTLIKEESGELAFKILPFANNNPFDHLQRQNYSTIILITGGKGKVKADVAEHEFNGHAIMFFSPYQPFMINTKGISGVALLFHSDFFCTFQFDKDNSCNRVLFDNIYERPAIELDDDSMHSLISIIEQMKTEMKSMEFGQYQLLRSYLQIFLITVSRIKINHQSKELEAFTNNKEPFILQSLRDAIEEHYRSKHAASQYAELLNITPKTLAKISKTHFKKTVMDLIAERIIIEAKRELYLTSKPVKSIAYELGFNDEFYFSRFFKTNTDISPKRYRETVGYARGELQD